MKIDKNLILFISSQKNSSRDQLIAPPPTGRFAMKILKITGKSGVFVGFGQELISQKDFNLE
jgi:hypothetical protein